MSIDVVFREAPVHPYRVLLVEDEAPDTVLAKHCVRGVWPDAEVVAVGSLAEAYSTYRSGGARFDLVLLDLNLPDGFGPMTVREMRYFNKSTPIVVLTGMGTDATVSEALRYGANHVALKSQMLTDDFGHILEQHVAEHGRPPSSLLH
ncbi:MAG: response regulator [Bdellovibrionales bacterium]